jgi:hypothetical protein
VSVPVPVPVPFPLRRGSGGRAVSCVLVTRPFCLTGLISVNPIDIYVDPTIDINVELS